jgi:hypothetical protein
MSAFHKYIAVLDRLDNEASTASIQSKPKLDPIAASAQELAVPIVPVQLNENKILDTAPDDEVIVSVTLLADMVNLPLTTPKSQLQMSMFKYVAVLDLLDLQHSKQDLHFKQALHSKQELCSKQDLLPATEQQLQLSVHVPEFHHSRDSPLLLSPFLPEISVARPVLHIDVSRSFLHRLAHFRRFGLLQ